MSDCGTKLHLTVPVKWQSAASSAKDGRDPGGHIASKQYNVWRYSLLWSMNMSSLPPRLLSEQSGCALRN